MVSIIAYGQNAPSCDTLNNNQENLTAQEFMDKIDLIKNMYLLNACCLLNRSINEFQFKYKLLMTMNRSCLVCDVSVSFAF